MDLWRYLSIPERKTSKGRAENRLAQTGPIRQLPDAFENIGRNHFPI
ncbi:MAG TPA: hypothetical protein VFD57_01650 [Clostridia bacterium]|nr:hypothetical protein [Clostridia bacterium]